MAGSVIQHLAQERSWVLVTIWVQIDTLDTQSLILRGSYQLMTFKQSKQTLPTRLGVRVAEEFHGEYRLQPALVLYLVYQYLTLNLSKIRSAKAVICQDELFEIIIEVERRIWWEIPKKVLEGEKTFVAVLTITQLEFSDTGTFTCTYNGTTDLDSIDNSTSVHLYVDDRNHLLRATSSFDFLHAVQSQTLILPCMPTHPDVNITLWREGTRGLERVFKSPYISYDPKVRSNNIILCLFK